MNNSRMQDRLTVASTIGATAAAGALIGLAAKYALGFSGYTMSPGELGAILGAVAGTALIQVLRKA